MLSTKRYVRYSFNPSTQCKFPHPQVNHHCLDNKFLRPNHHPRIRLIATLLSRTTWSIQLDICCSTYCGLAYGWLLQWRDLNAFELEHSLIVLRELIKILDKHTTTFTTMCNNTHRLVDSTMLQIILTCNTPIFRQAIHHSPQPTLRLPARLRVHSCSRMPAATRCLIPFNLHLAVPHYRHNTETSQEVTVLRPCIHTIPQIICTSERPLTIRCCRKLRNKIQ